jgi:hypothetical protein
MCIIGRERSFLLSTFLQLAIPAPTFNEFGIWYFVFGLFVALGFIMLGIILLAEPDQQYDIDSLTTMPEDQIPPLGRKSEVKSSPP